MSNLLVFDEYAEGGRPVWRVAAARREQLRFHGDRRWSKRDRTSSLYPEEVNTTLRTYAKPWATYDLGPGSQGEYALYDPWTEDDLHWLCKSAWRQGSLAAIAPMEIAKEPLIELTRIGENELRPLAYMSRTDLCEVAQVPWLCMLCLYPYHVTISVFSAKSGSLLDEVVAAGQGLAQFKVIPLKEALAFEQWQWETHYRQFDPHEPPRPLSPEAKEAIRQWTEFAKEMERRAEEQRHPPRHRRRHP